MFFLGFFSVTVKTIPTIKKFKYRYDSKNIEFFYSFKGTIKEDTEKFFDNNYIEKYNDFIKDIKTKVQLERNEVNKNLNQIDAILSKI